MSNIVSNLWNSVFDRDQLLFDNLSEQQKIAFCRLAKELALADGAVNKDEKFYLPEIPITYFTNAGKLTLDDAYQSLKSLDQSKLKKIIKELEEMGEADGLYTEEERHTVKTIREALL
jgi:uncharacterized tellurite resistance protein B-like protein